MYTLRQYLNSLEDSHGLTRTLGEVDVCRDAQGRMCYSAGNSAAVFRIRHAGRICSLRCYFRPMRHLREIYGPRLLEKELYLYLTPQSGLWADVVLGDWIAGVTLSEAIARAIGDAERLHGLATAFDRLAREMLTDDKAHGDLKPENIIVCDHQQLHLIDLDASYLPAFAGENSPELGTAAYQHPARTAHDFDAHLDDYPAALISTALHALTLDPTLYARHNASDGLLFSPRMIHHDPALNEALALFERAGMARQYRVAELLRAPTPRLFGLAELLEQPPASDSTTPELFAQHGHWGYRTADRIVIPPLYDCGFDFTEGLAAVQLYRTWHFIDATGRTRLSCPDYDAVKPFRNGRAEALRHGLRIQIDTTGQEFDI